MLVLKGEDVLRNTLKLRSTIVGALTRLICILLLGGLLVGIQTYLVSSGRIPVALNLNAVIHFVAITVVCLISGLIVKENATLHMLIGMAGFYVLSLLIGGVVFDGLGQGSIYGFLGGLTGIAVSLLTSVTRKRKTAKWKVKKYGC